MQHSNVTPSAGLFADKWVTVLVISLGWLVKFSDIGTLHNSSGAVRFLFLLCSATFGMLQLLPHFGIPAAASLKLLHLFGRNLLQCLNWERLLVILFCLRGKKPCGLEAVAYSFNTKLQFHDFLKVGKRTKSPVAQGRGDDKMLSSSSPIYLYRIVFWRAPSNLGNGLLRVLLRDFYRGLLLEEKASGAFIGK